MLRLQHVGDRRSRVPVERGFDDRAPRVAEGDIDESEQPADRCRSEKRDDDQGGEDAHKRDATLRAVLSKRHATGGPRGYCDEGYNHDMSLLLLAAIPFALKAAVLWIGWTGYALQSLYKLAQLAIPMLWNLAKGERGRHAFLPAGAGRPSAQLLLAAAAVAVVFSGAAILLAHTLLPLLSVDPLAIRAGLDARFAMSPAAALGVVIFLAALNSALEEWHFRWWLDRELSARWGSKAGIAVSALAFGSMHAFIFAGTPGIPAYAIVLAALGIAVGGGAWSMLLRKPGGFYGAWLSHGLTDALLLGWGLWWLDYL
jgi:membrane protease YdiL (CAAX protease family)